MQTAVLRLPPDAAVGARCPCLPWRRAGDEEGRSVQLKKWMELRVVPGIFHQIRKEKLDYIEQALSILALWSAELRTNNLTAVQQRVCIFIY